MSAEEIADAPFVRKRLQPRWSRTTTTTAGTEIRNYHVTSEGEEPGLNVVYAVVPYAREMARPLPPRAGRTLWLEGDLEQVVYMGNFGVALTAMPDFPPLNFGLPPYCRITPSPVFHDELLDWDIAIEVAPKRRAGMIMVSLEYAGRDKPTPVDDPWD